MKVLVAEDDPISRQLLCTVLARWGYEVIPTQDGPETWQTIQKQGSPLIIILDWMLPDIEGTEICRRIRTIYQHSSFHIILLTAFGRQEDLLKGFECGADDYICKPFDLQELRVRIRVGERVVQLQTDLANRVLELEKAMSQVKKLEGLVPICSYCKKIRDDQNYWHQLERYISERSDATFTHGVCPECHKKFLDSLSGNDRRSYLPGIADWHDLLG